MGETDTSLRHERRWLVAGAVVSAVVIAAAAYHRNDFTKAFVEALGAVGQVGIAIAVFAVNRAQWKLQERTVREERARVASERTKLIDHAKAEARDAIDAFYRSRDPEARERQFELMTAHFADLRREMPREIRDTMVAFVRSSNRILANSLAGEDGANGRLMPKWREDANQLLTLVGEHPLPF